jgi:hypothetical protein
LRWSLANFLPRLTLNCNLPDLPHKELGLQVSPCAQVILCVCV